MSSGNGSRDYRGDRVRPQGTGQPTQRDTRSRSPVRYGGRGQGQPRHPDAQAQDNRHNARDDLQNKPPSDIPYSHQIITPQGSRDLNVPELMPRGTEGAKFMATTNHHLIRALPTKPIWAYDLKIEIPDDSVHKNTNEASIQQKARVLLKREVLDFLGEDYVFDGVSQVWSPHEIVPEGQSRHTIVAIEQRRDGKPNNIKLSIHGKGRLNVVALAKYMIAGVIELDPAGNPALEDQIKWIQACFRKDPASRLVTRPNNSCYFDRSPGSYLTLKSTAGVLEARRGVFQTMQIRFAQLTMNIDTATTPFWVPNVCLLNFAAAMLGIQPHRLNDPQFAANPHLFRTRATKMYGIYFHVRHLGPKANAMKLKMRSFANGNALDTTFDERKDDGSTARTNVNDYFRKKYNVILKYPKLPLVSTTKGDFPLESCFSADGERYKELLQGSETADFIRWATCYANDRKIQIEGQLRMLSHHTNTTLKAHGIVMEPRMMRVKARLLKAPVLTYGARRTVMPAFGKWNLRGIQFLRPMAIKSWVMVYLPHKQPMPEATIGTFNREMIRSFRALGMVVPPTDPPLLIGNPQGHMQTIVDDAIKKAKAKYNQGPNVIFFVLQGMSNQIYQLLKMGLDVKLGIPSQVMLEDKGFLNQKGLQQYVANIAMKVNVKLGGTNCTAANPMFDAAPCMLLGGDISHATPGQLRSANPPPSCAALVGTWDKACTAYTAVTGMQESTYAMIANIKPMFTELLKRYTEKNEGRYPRHIFYFRDGVSESEFQAIKMQEAKPLKDLLTELGQQVRITLIVAVKRHHTRFFTEMTADNKVDPHGTHRGNVHAGTCVENARASNDIYLVSQPELIGTKRPTRYVTIVDENNLSPDVYQRLCNSLCSSYARATTSVAVAPPIYYADQACERARLHLQDDKVTGLPTLGPVHPNLRWNMWWQ